MDTSETLALAGDVTTILNQEKITSWKEQILDTAGNIIKIPCN